MKTFLVYYAKLGCDHTFQMNNGETVDRDQVLNQSTHILVTTVQAQDFTTVWDKMQGENWSPNGEARTLLNNIGLLNHTSMSVGDCVYDPTIKELYVVQGLGFKKSDQPADLVRLSGVRFPGSLSRKTFQVGEMEC